MNSYINEMIRRKQELETAIANAEQVLRKSPLGSIRTTVSEGRVYYYRITKETSPKGKYIPKSHQDIIGKLIQKEYTKAFLKLAGKELKQINSFLKYQNVIPPERAVEKLYRNKIDHVSPYLYSDDEYGRRWEKEPYLANDYKPVDKVYPTLKGEKVRSKSEALLADMYYELGVPYRYECALKFSNGKVRYPDFTLLDTKKRKLIYHEHMGLMEDDRYRKDNLSKLNEYRKNGIFTGRNLILTFEGPGYPFNIADIKKSTEEMFL